MEDLWQRFTAWLRQHAPGLLTELNEGASEAELQQLTDIIGVVPPDVMAFYRIHNGQRSNASGLFEGEELLSTGRMLAEWKIWNDLLTDGTFEGNTSEPAAGVRPAWWNPRWLPFTYNGAGDHYCLDLDPAPEGKPGQIIRMWHDDGARPREAPSFRAWMTRYVEGLEAGDYAYSQEYDGIVPLEYLEDEA